MGEGRKKGPGGGGASLNFKVKDYATEELLMAATGKDNEIGIITSTPMTGWHFGAEYISGQIDISNAVNAANVVSGVSNGVISFKGDLFPEWSSTYIAKLRLVAGIKYVLAANLGYGRFSISKSPNDIPDSVIDFVESLTCGNILSFEKQSVELTPLVTADYYINFCTDETGANGAKPSFSTGVYVYPKDVNVWIKTGTTSTVAFNVLKKNGITVYPISAKQYINGAWVDVTAKSWKNGAWVDWIDFDSFIVYKGVARKEFVKNNGSISITQNTDNVYITSNSNGYWTVWVEDVDLTNAKTLVIEGSFMVNATKLQVWEKTVTSPGTGNAKASAVMTVTGGSLDVSQLSGLYRVGFSWESSRTHTITGFRYEK